MNEAAEDTTKELIDELERRVSIQQIALEVVYELAVRGPGNAGQIAERMTWANPEGGSVQEAWVDEAFGELDTWSLLDLPGPENEDGPVALVSRS